MFPVGGALLPGEPHTLYLFEPRYLAMAADIGDTGSFGVVLIERGPEVGGGDTRFDVGTVATIVEMERLDHGELGILARGGERIAVDRWLPDDPYPMALVRGLPEHQPPGPERVVRLVGRLRRLYALASELGMDGGDIDLTLPDDPPSRLWRVASLTPAGQLDRQRMLEAADAEDLLALLDALVDDVEEEIRWRLAGSA